MWLAVSLGCISQRAVLFGAKFSESKEPVRIQHGMYCWKSEWLKFSFTNNTSGKSWNPSDSPPVSFSFYIFMSAFVMLYAFVCLNISVLYTNLNDFRIYLSVLLKLSMFQNTKQECQNLKFFIVNMATFQ